MERSLTPQEIVKQAEKEKALYEYDGPDQIVESRGLYTVLKARSKQVTDRFLSNIPALDDYLKGFYPGEVSVISGPTKQGKTLLCQTITGALPEQNKRALWFTYEVPVLQFMEQYGEDLPSFLLPAQLKGNSLDWINQRVFEAKVKFGLDAVFIDHLHYLVDMNRHNISLEIGHVMRFIKKLAVHHNIHIFMVAHLAKIEIDKEPDETNLRDSSFVGQECDNCLILWRVRNKDNQTCIKIALNRRFGIMGKKVWVEKIGPYLRELDFTREDED